MLQTHRHKLIHTHTLTRKLSSFTRILHMSRPQSSPRASARELGPELLTRAFAAVYNSHSPRSSLPYLTLGVAPTPKTTSNQRHTSPIQFRLYSVSKRVPWTPYTTLTRPYSPTIPPPRPEILIRSIAALLEVPLDSHHLCPREATSSPPRRLHSDFTCAIYARAAMATAAVAKAAVPAAAKVKAEAGWAGWAGWAAARAKTAIVCTGRVRRRGVVWVARRDGVT